MIGIGIECLQQTAILTTEWKTWRKLRQNDEDDGEDETACRGGVVTRLAGSFPQRFLCRSTLVLRRGAWIFAACGTMIVEIDPTVPETLGRFHS